MRVISGAARGRLLVSPKGMGTRPTAERIKESVFNIISPHLMGARFLDLFAGTGAIGIEALSRGAEKCVFVENDRQAYQVLLKNIENTRLGERAETFFTDADAALRRLAKTNGRFDIIFMDPPYGQAHQMAELTRIISGSGLLEAEGFIIGEHGLETDVSAFGNVELLRRKNYGKTVAVSFWRPILGEQ